MRLPEELAELGKKRIEGNAVEGFVYGEGPDQPVFMLVGEAPGETEIHTGVPFSGRAGKKLMEFIAGLGLVREDVFITSAVRSRPYKWRKKKERDGSEGKKKYNRAPTSKEIIAHAPLLDYEVQHVDAPLIVTLGNVGLKRLVGNEHSITKDHGSFLYQSVQEWDGEDGYRWSEKKYTIFPTFHPASIFYNPKLKEMIENDQHLLKQWLQEHSLR
ncbi:uracil-DNA glycosylase [Bacillus testis]|uniref:uracil-DNA glycosylase n=1 Tax=Bacillus testis TaxID=1622072 RepID=UPI00067E80ED|nr:uracil-DNA glycosylase [Bacillus testis]